MKKIVVGTVLLAVIVGVLFSQYGDKILNQNKKSEDVTIKIWGLWEDENLIRPVLSKYKEQNPHVKIEYELQNITNYRTRVQAQIAGAEGPDIFMIHNSWLPMFTSGNLLATLPTDLMSQDQYKKDFYPVAAESFTQDDRIYALPLEVDGLSLFVNEKILESSGEKVPKTWDEFSLSAKKLTKIENKKIVQAGAALGSTNNVDHWQEIIGLLFKQNPGADLAAPNNTRGAEVLRFYTNFISDPEMKVWDVDLESSTQAFALGKLAFYLAPSWRVHEIREQNQQLQFKTVPVPQLACEVGKECSKVAWATFWAYSVAASSKHQRQAWEFLKYFTSEYSQKELYQQASKVRLFGQPYSRVSLRTPELLADPIAGSFVEQGPYYKGWYLASRTFDGGGINDQMNKYYGDAINAVVIKGMDPLKALNTTAQGVAQVLKQYGLSK